MARTPKTLNVCLTPALVGFVAVGVASGRCQTASEVVRAGLRLLDHAEAAPPSNIASSRARRVEKRSGSRA
ncbi:MAG TPA: type II toxin-antitoxin system ParD family antitoxin [Acetobacteraceae bacterium]|nr:type II toxin-antitoxin system ParD family antitoxin [Acetobacteraceae bacterium]